jgi:hypothetical protein
MLSSGEQRQIRDASQRRSRHVERDSRHGATATPNGHGPCSYKRSLPSISQPYTIRHGSSSNVTARLSLANGYACRPLPRENHDVT